MYLKRTTLQAVSKLTWQNLYQNFVMKLKRLAVLYLVPISVGVVLLLTSTACSTTREIPIPDIPPPDIPTIEIPQVTLPESAMLACRVSPYIPVSAFDPKTQAELIAVNIVQVRTDRDLCRQKHSALVEWILSTHRSESYQAGQQ